MVRLIDNIRPFTNLNVLENRVVEPLGVYEPFPYESFPKNEEMG